MPTLTQGIVELLLCLEISLAVMWLRFNVAQTLSDQQTTNALKAK